MTDDLYNKAAADLDHVLSALMAARLATGKKFDPEIVVANIGVAKSALQADTDVATVAMRGVPDGLQGQYRTYVGMAHDRAVALFQAALLL